MGTSTNYKAPTSPQWGELKGKVTRLVGQETPDATDIDIPETPDATDIDTPETSDAADIDIPETPDATDIDTPETSDAADIDTPETPDAADIDTPEIAQIVTDFVKVNYGSLVGISSGEDSNPKDSSGRSGIRRGGTSSPGATARRRAARNVAQNIGGFFSSVADLGFKEAFEQAGLGLLEGKSVREIAYSLLDYLGGPSSTLDQVDARKALTDLMGDIFHDVNSPEDVEEEMEKISHGESFADMIRSFFGHYINAQFIRSFYERITARKPGTQLFDRIRNFIRDAVKFKVRHQDVRRINWSGDQGRQIIDNIFQNTLEVFDL